MFYIEKLMKSVIDKPRFTIISTNLRDCVSQTIQVRVVATKTVATRSCRNIYKLILFTCLLLPGLYRLVIKTHIRPLSVKMLPSSICAALEP